MVRCSLTNNNKIPEPEWLSQNYRYNPSTGYLYNSRGRKIGSYTQKYPRLCIKGYTYPIHRLAFVLMEGSWPSESLEVDHINGDTHDNRWENLRLLPKGLNIFNSRKQRENQDTGVYFEKWSGKWVAQLKHNKKTYKRKFVSKEDAIMHRKSLTNKFINFESN